jgi:hypothetical protein
MHNCNLCFGMASQQQNRLDAIYGRLAELSAEIRGLRKSGILLAADARKAEQLYREIVTLRLWILRNRFGQSAHGAELFPQRSEHAHSPSPTGRPSSKVAPRGSLCRTR